MTARPRWHDYLGLNRSTLALLGAIFLVTAATELWSPLVPQYIKAYRERFLAGDSRLILLIGFYGFYRDALETVNYYLGGAIAGRFNTRRALLFFNLLPLVGLAFLAHWRSEYVVFAAVPLLFVWDSIAGPATITVVGAALPPERRAMAFSLQAILRRLSRIAAYGISGLVVWRLGRLEGVRADALIAIGLVLAAAVVQLRYMRTAARDAQLALDRPLALLRRFSPDLRMLLAADVCARWSEGLCKPFIILFCVPILARSDDTGTALYQSLLLNVEAVTNIVLYIAIAPLASRAGLAKKPYIGLTFVFFALFPIALALLGRPFGMWGLAAAFVVAGCREIGEPARKAMISEFVPADVKTQAIGLYWSVRGLLVMFAAPVGALAWLAGERWSPGGGPIVLFLLAGVVGLTGAAAFFARFGRFQSAANR